MAGAHHDVLKKIAANVRAVRLRHGMTQEELAAAADLDVRRVQRAERAEVDIGLIGLQALADALDVPPGRFFRRAVFETPRAGRPSKKKRPTNG